MLEKLPLEVAQYLPAENKTFGVGDKFVLSALRGTHPGSRNGKPIAMTQDVVLNGEVLTR